MSVNAYFTNKALKREIQAQIIDYGAILGSVASISANGLLCDIKPLITHKNASVIKNVLIAKNPYINAPIASGDKVLLIKTSYSLEGFALLGSVSENVSVNSFVALPLATQSDFLHKNKVSIITTEDVSIKAMQGVEIGGASATLGAILADLLQQLISASAVPAANGKPIMDSSISKWSELLTKCKANFK